MPDISSGMPIGPQPGDPGMSGPQSTPVGPGGAPGMGNSAMLKIMGPIALAYLQNIAQQSQQGGQLGDLTTSNDDYDGVLDDQMDRAQHGEGQGQSLPPGGKLLSTAHGNQPQSPGTLPLGSINSQDASPPGGGGKPVTRGSAGGGRIPMRSGGGSSISRIGGHVRPSKAPPVAKIKTPPKEGKTPPPA